MKYSFVRNPKRFCLSLLIIVLAAIAVSFPLTAGRSHPASPARSVLLSSTGATNLITIQGSNAGLPNGDYVSDISGLNTAYRFFIEVPPGLGRLKVEIFDADIGLGEANEANAGRDRARTAFDSSVRYTLRDPAGKTVNTLFTTGDATGPAGSDNAWLSLFDATDESVRDDFSNASYSNNGGTINWSTDWIETNDDDTPTGGAIRITGGELRIGSTGEPASVIEREADLSGFPDAVLSFDCRTEGVAPTDRLELQISDNGGATWNTLETFTGTVAAASRSYDIGSYISSNTRIRFIPVNGYGAGDFFYVDDLRIKSPTVPAGHWELRVDMSSAVTSGDDINAFGIRANDGDAGAGGTELNVYADSIYSIGVNPPASGIASRSYTLHPYITSGCSCAKNDFDYDSTTAPNVGSFLLTSTPAVYNQSYGSTSLSGNAVWRRDFFSQWTSDHNSGYYGIWTLNAVINSYLVAGVPNGNYASLYFSNFQAPANPPSNSTADTFRIYLPTDAGTTPLKPYIEQNMLHIDGPNPPVVGQPTRERLVVRIINPTAYPITFSDVRTVTANVPGGAVVYAGGAQAGQGAILSQPAVGGAGNIVWNPGTVAAGATTFLSYNVTAALTAPGQRVVLTGTPSSGNGTRATFVDETGNQMQARATYTFGPVCELAVTVGNIVPVSNCGNPVINPNSLPNAAVGAYYSQSFSPAVEFFSGNLPDGLSITNGVLSGTATESGTFTFLAGTPLSSSGCGTSRYYTLTVLAPTAAGVTIGGRVSTAEGRGISGAVIEMIGADGDRRQARTNPFGYFRFYDVEAGETYVFQVRHKKYVFDPQAMTINDDISELNFVPRE